MAQRTFGLQPVVILPILALVLLAGSALYLLVLRTVSEYADAAIRANMDSLAASIFAIADAEVDRQNVEGRSSDEQSRPLYQLNALTRFEDFAREHEIGVIVETNKEVTFSAGSVCAGSLSAEGRPAQIGTARVVLENGATCYLRSIGFAPWNWRLTLKKDAADFDELIAEVQKIYAGSAVAIVLVAGLLVLFLRQVLVKPIFRIASDFSEGRAPAHRGIRELEHLSHSIGSMMESLNAKTLHLQTTLESMSDGIAVFDKDMRLVAWNKHYVDLYQYPPDLIRAGTSFADIMQFNIDRGDYGQVNPGQQLKTIVERAKNLDPPRFEIDRADGTTMEVRRAPMPDGGFVTTYTDITHRKEAIRLEAVNEAKSQFLRNMSHDLRKPATAIIEDARLMLDTPEHAKADRKNLERIHVTAEHLLNMIDELLEMSRIEAGQIEVRPEPVSIETLVDHGLGVIDAMAKAKGLSVSKQIESELEAKTDPRLFSRIIMNLVSNAAEHTSDGSISVCARSINGRVEVSVADTGAGIPADKLGHIFEKFQQVEPMSGIIQPGMGLGLGLSISREFAHLLGGELTVKSQLGEGSIFTVSVPTDCGER